MNKKGFTLPEMLGVIIILGIIILIVLPIVDNLIKNSKLTAYKAQIKNIEVAARNWSLKNSDLLPDTEGNCVTVFLGELKQLGELKLDIKNPETKKLISNNSNVEITYKNNNYEYKINIIDTNLSDSSKDHVISMEGKTIDYVEVNQYNTPYSIPNVTAKTYSGEIIPNTYISYQILKDGVEVSNINTNHISNYVINYTVSYGGISNTYKKMVAIRDTTKPELIVGDNIETHDVSSINFNSGVSVSDNSGESITPVIRSTVSNVPGIYYVYYTATDSSGNTTSKRRQVIVH